MLVVLTEAEQEFVARYGKTKPLSEILPQAITEEKLHIQSIATDIYLKLRCRSGVKKLTEAATRLIQESTDSFELGSSIEKRLSNILLCLGSANTSTTHSFLVSQLEEAACPVLRGLILDGLSRERSKFDFHLITRHLVFAEDVFELQCALFALLLHRYGFIEPHAPEVISPYFHHENWLVRLYAAQILSTPKTVDSLRALVNDPVQEVSVYAREALAQ